MFVLDSNTLIYFFKGSGKVAKRLLATAPKDVGIPAIALYELEVGAATSLHPGRRRQQLDALAAAATILPFDWRAAKESAELRVALERRGQGIGPLDTLIAGTALACSGVLVTHNTKEFSRIPGLKLVDWY